MVAVGNIEIPYDEIVEFCRHWKVTEFALFGSVLRDDFRPDSDIDVLVTLAPDASQRFDDWLTMEEQLESLFRRKVDLVNKQAVVEGRNWIRRNHILKNQQVLYVA
jgi:uncharacterized protein